MTLSRIATRSRKDPVSHVQAQDDIAPESETATETGTRLRPWLIVIIMMLVGLGLRLFELGGKSFWSDETYSWFFALDDLPTMWANGGLDPHHPPLYHTILKWFIGMSQSESSLRLPSAIASTLTIGVVALIGKQVSSIRVGLVAAALLAASPLDIWYAQEARQAALGTLFGAISVYALTRRDTIGRLVGPVSLLAALLTYYITALLWAGVLGICLGALGKRWRRMAAEWLWISVPAMIVFIPLHGAHFFNGMNDLVSVSEGTLLGRLLSIAYITDNAVGILALACIGGAILSRLLAWLTRRWPPVMLYAGVLTYGALLFAASVDRGYTFKRILIVGLPLGIVALAYMISERLQSRSRAILMAGLLTASVVSSVTVLGIPKDDWRSAVAHVNSNATPDEVIWVLGPPEPWAVSPFEYYDAEPRLVPAQRREDLSHLAAEQPGGIWLVASRTPRDAIPSSATEEWLDEEWRLEETVPLTRLEVRHYAPPADQDN
jgi:mannosyltransferase